MGCELLSPETLAPDGQHTSVFCLEHVLAQHAWLPHHARPSHPSHDTHRSGTAMRAATRRWCWSRRTAPSTSSPLTPPPAAPPPCRRLCRPCARPRRATRCVCCLCGVCCVGVLRDVLCGKYCELPRVGLWKRDRSHARPKRLCECAPSAPHNHLHPTQRRARWRPTPPAAPTPRSRWYGSQWTASSGSTAGASTSRAPTCVCACVRVCRERFLARNRLRQCVRALVCVEWPRHGAVL
jgi:hypothetical protein